MSTPRAAADRPGARNASPPSTRRARPAAARLLPWLCALLVLSPPPAVRAQTIGRLATRIAAPGEVIVMVRANGVDRGEFTVGRPGGGDFWIRAADLPRLDLQPREQARRDLAGETWYSVRALGAAPVEFEEETLALRMDFPAAALPGTRIDLSSRPVPTERSPARNSVVLAYRATAIQSSTGGPQALLAADLNVRVDGLLLRQEVWLNTKVPRKGLRRGSTQVIHDDLQNARRHAAGDVLSTAGAYGTTITGGGVLFAKVYDLVPEFVRYPSARVQASTTSPADVEVSVDGSPVYRGRVAPGPIALDNLVQTGGTRNVQVVITDASGRRQVIAQPFLFTDTVLAQGLHEYSYFAGRRSELQVDNSWRYREPAWQAFHRYGVTDGLTVAAGGEGNGEFHNAGAGIALRSDTLGLLALDALTSHDHVRHTEARGWSGRYTYPSPAGTLLLARRGFGAGFRGFGTVVNNPFPRSETRVALSKQFGPVSASADLVRTVTERDVRDNGFLRLAARIARGVWLLAEWQTTRIDDRKGWAGNIYLRADLDPQHWISSTTRLEPTGNRFDIEAGKELPDGEGLGYRLGVGSDWTRGARQTGGSAYGSLDWNLRPASVNLFASSGFRGEGSTYWQADVAGAVVGLDDYVGMTRQITDAFVLARLGVPQPGVEILLNNQPQGRTDAQGRLLIPQVTSLARQEVSVNEQELRIDYTLRSNRRIIAAPYRSGMVVDFGISRMRAVAGTAWLVEAGRRTPVAARAFELTGPGGPLSVGTAASGEFYLEDAPPGRYAGTLQSRGRSHACRMTVPESEEAVQELKEGIVCE